MMSKKILHPHCNPGGTFTPQERATNIALGILTNLSTSLVMSLHAHGTLKLLIAAQHPGDGGIVGPDFWTNFEHSDISSGRLPPHWPDTSFVLYINVPTITMIANFK